MIQGPFNSLEMDNWYNKGFLPMDLMVGLADREKCVKLSDFISSTYPFKKNPDLYHTIKDKPVEKWKTMTPQPEKTKSGNFFFPS